MPYDRFHEEKEASRATHDPETRALALLREALEFFCPIDPQSEEHGDTAALVRQLEEVDTLDWLATWGEDARTLLVAGGAEPKEERPPMTPAAAMEAGRAIVAEVRRMKAEHDAQGGAGAARMVLTWSSEDHKLRDDAGRPVASLTFEWIPEETVAAVIGALGLKVEGEEPDA
jgi:hypothetical protein